MFGKDDHNGHEYVDISHFRAPYKDSGVSGFGDYYSGSEDEMNFGYGVYGVGADPAPAAKALREAAVVMETDLVPPTVEGGATTHQDTAVIVPTDHDSYVDTLRTMGAGKTGSYTGSETTLTLLPVGTAPVAAGADAYSWLVKEAAAGNFVLAPRSYDPFVADQQLISTKNPAVIQKYAAPSGAYAVLAKPQAGAGCPPGYVGTFPDCKLPVIMPIQPPPPQPQPGQAKMGAGTIALIAVVGAGALYYFMQPKKRTPSYAGNRRSRR
jgi:hypothetical protein